jgi:hypothetical protein
LRFGLVGDTFDSHRSIAMNAHPPTASTGIPRDTFADIRVIGVRQKGIMVCILVYLIGVAAMFVVPTLVRPFVLVGLVVTSVVAVVFVFLLALRVYGTVLGAVLCILTLAPLIGLFVLLAVDQKATHLLRRAGVHVGLLGARMSDMP